MDSRMYDGIVYFAFVLIAVAMFVLLIACMAVAVAIGLASWAAAGKVMVAISVAGVLFLAGYEVGSRR